MRKRKAGKRAAWCAACALAVGITLSAGCAPQANTAQPEEKESSEQTAASLPGNLESDPMQPIVKKLSDGTLIQRTPDEDISPTWDADAMWHHPEESVPANTYYTNADERGCNACHEDLAQTLKNSPYDHHPLTSPDGLEITVEQCVQCHRYKAGTTVQTINGEFGTLIHGLHLRAENIECMNCHDASGNTEGKMVLWDAVKHEKLRGITDIASTDLGDSFAWNQDRITPVDELMDVTWLAYESDYERYDRAHGKEEVPLDEELFNTWEFSVFGQVEKEMSWTLPELIEQAPSEELVMKYICNANPTNGNMVGQVEVKGIPISWMLEQAGVADGAEWIAAYMPEGSFGGSDLLEDVMDEDKAIYLVYEMNGERLTWANGYPAIYMRGDESAYQAVKSCTGIEVSSGKRVRDFNGWDYKNPNVGIYNLHEGQIIPTGETHTFEGYVDGFNEEVVALEVSMDRGKTWKTFPIENSDVNRLITWSYDFTPQEDTAYCISVRGVTESGLATPEYIEKMVVSKSEMPVVE